MEKEKKLEQVYNLAVKLGLSPLETSDYFLSKVPISLLKEREILPGMFVDVDNQIFADIIDRNRIKAVVCYVENSTVFAICLKSANLPWSRNFLNVTSTIGMTDGKKATQLILEAAQNKNQGAEAANWCYNYTYDGVKRGEAFIPTVSEMEKLSKNIKAIGISLKKLKEPLLCSRYWTSNEYSDNAAEGHYLDDSEIIRSTAARNKNSDQMVRPLIQIKL